MNKKILIVGLGLIGGSYAEALSDLGYEVGAIDIDESSIEYALKNNLIKSGRTTVKEDYISSFDVIIFCLYPHVLIDFIKQYQYMFKPNTLLNDVTGVKVKLIEEVMKIKREDVDFVFSHPMAGREKSGVYFHNKNIFKKANFIITPVEGNKHSNLDFISEMAKEMGFKNISFLTPEQHDEMIGFLSQLTHCIAVSLMTSKDSEHLYEYTGDSFKDLTRIAKINENMWSELFLMNKEELLSQMDLFINQFVKLRTSIENDDVETMKEMMKLSTKRRSYFDD